MAGGGWAPLRHPDFRRLWAAQFTSNIGSWMQTVAAQWVMTSLTGSPLLLTAVSAAGSLPVLLLAVPAGALGDLMDRRKLILTAQATMLVAAAGLALLSAVGSLTAWVLLGLLFVIGVGGAIAAPTWQTLQPELVPEADRSQAIALGSVNQNLARAIGPAIGGLLLAATSAALVFLVNAASFVAVLGGVAATPIAKRESALPREHAIAAVRAGGRFVRNSPGLLAVIVRATAFVFFAGSIWALLPLVARDRLGLGSGGYGMLLACVGIGALLAANFGPKLKEVLTPRPIYALACLLVAAAAATLAISHSVAVVAVALVAAGAAWIIALGLLNNGYQGELPQWVKARSFAYYLVAFQGANAIGALAMGTVAQATSVTTALYVVAGGLLVGSVATWMLPLATGGDHVGLTADPLPLPQMPQNPEQGPVTVVVDYSLAPGKSEAFLALADELWRMRRRGGAVSWHLNHDIDDPDLFKEEFIVGSWEQHELQHAHIVHRERELLDSIDALLRDGQPRAAQHLIGVRPPHHHR